MALFIATGYQTPESISLFFFCTSSDVLSAYSHLNVPIKASINLSLCRVSTIFYASFQNYSSRYRYNLPFFANPKGNSITLTFFFFFCLNSLLFGSIMQPCVNCSIIYRLIFNSKNLFEEYLKFKIKRIILRTILSILKFQTFM